MNLNWFVEIESFRSVKKIRIEHFRFRSGSIQQSSKRHQRNVQFLSTIDRRTKARFDQSKTSRRNLFFLSKNLTKTGIGRDLLRTAKSFDESNSETRRNHRTSKFGKKFRRNEKKTLIFLFFFVQPLEFSDRLFKSSSTTEILMFKKQLENRFSALHQPIVEINGQLPFELEFVSNFQAMQTGVRNTFGYVRSSIVEPNSSVKQKKNFSLQNFPSVFLF